MATHALEAVELVKTYPAGRKKPPLRALDGLTFSVGEGVVLGLLGPNGAGKSTTVKIFTTLSRADSGTARVAGYDVDAEQDRVRRSIGYVPQKSSSDPLATGIENLVLSGRIHGLSRADATSRAIELLDRFGLAEHGSRPVRTYSGGMQRKLDVAIGLVHRPRVLFLDEPTTGLDPEARADLWTEVQQLAGSERLTVLLTTHYLEEADRLADQLAIVDNGKVVAEGTPEALKAELHGDTIQIELADQAYPLTSTRSHDPVPAGGGAGARGGGVGAAGGGAGARGSGADVRGGGGSFAMVRELVGRLPGVGEVVAEGKVLRARVGHGASAVPVILAALEEREVPVVAVTVSRPSLDDVYLRYTGRSFREAERINDEGQAA